MNRLRISFRKSDLKTWCLSVLVFFCFFENTYIQRYINLSQIQKILGIGIILLHLIILCMSGGEKSRKRPLWNCVILCIFFYGWLFLVTYFHGGLGRVYNAIYANFGSFLVIFLVQYYSYDEKKILNILDTWKYIIFVLVLVDLASEILYPQGLYSSIYDSYNWFLGYKTSRVLYSLPMCAMFFYTSLKRKRKISFNCWIVLLVAVYDAFLSQATAASVALLLCGFFTFLLKNKFFNKFIEKLANVKIFYIVYFALTFMIVVSQSADLLGFFASAFGKSTTFSGRTVIWLNCINSIISSKGMGVGYLTSDLFAEITNWSRGTNAHNQVLGLLVCGGIPAFIIYYYMIYRADKKRCYTKDVVKMFIYGIMILGITSDTFTYSVFGFFMIWLLEYSNDKRIQQNNFTQELIK